MRKFPLIITLLPRNVAAFPLLNIRHSTISKQGFACFIWLLEVPYLIKTSREPEFRLQYHESNTEIQRIPAVTCVARTVEEISSELPGETSFQFLRLLDISSYLSR